MNGGICLCMFLAALAASCFARPRSAPAQAEGRPALLAPQAGGSAPGHRRHARSLPSGGPVKHYAPPEDEAETRVNLSELLARLISRKGSVRRNSTVNSRVSGLSGLSTNHRIKDRDYLGWMDFGRRSAEEYEYSS